MLKITSKKQLYQVSIISFVGLMIINQAAMQLFWDRFREIEQLEQNTGHQCINTLKLKNALTDFYQQDFSFENMETLRQAALNWENLHKQLYRTEPVVYGPPISEESLEDLRTAVARVVEEKHIDRDTYFFTRELLTDYGADVDRQKMLSYREYTDLKKAYPWIELGISVITVLLLFSGFWFVFRPAFNRLLKQAKELQAVNREMESLTEELSSNEEALLQNLNTAQKTIKGLKTQERDLQDEKLTLTSQVEKLQFKLKKLSETQKLDAHYFKLFPGFVLAVDRKGNIEHQRYFGISSNGHFEEQLSRKLKSLFSTDEVPQTEISTEINGDDVLIKVNALDPGRFLVIGVFLSDRDKEIEIQKELVEIAEKEVSSRMTGLYDMVQRLDNRNEPLAEKQKLLFKQNENINLFLNQFFDLCQLSMKSRQPTGSQHNLNEFLNGVVATAPQPDNKGHLKVKAEIQVFDVVVSFDNELLGKALYCLIREAIELSGSGGITLKAIGEKIETKTLEVRFDILFSGDNLVDENLREYMGLLNQEVFSPASKYGSSGFNLALAHRIIQLMEGELAFVPDAQKAFRFTLKFKRPSGEGLHLKNTGFTDSKELQGIKVLLVEDNPQSVMLAKRYLESWGCEAKVAASGEVAIEMVGNTDFDVVLVDLHMPEMEGFSTARAIRAKTPGSFPVIGITADATGETAERIKIYEISDVLVKPYTKKSLYLKLAGILNKV